MKPIFSRYTKLSIIYLRLHLISEGLKMIIEIILGIIIISALTAVILFNQLRRANINVDEAFSQIDVQLKRRSDLIPNLVETVKGYAAHESSTFQAVTEARSATMKATTFDDKVASDGMMTNALKGLLAISEKYPDLKASANFLALQEELSTTENKISFSRQYYNDSVSSLNTLVATIPTSLLAGAAKVSARAFYKVDSEADRARPDVKF